MAYKFKLIVFLLGKAMALLAFFPNEFIENVLQRNDIVDVISSSGVAVKGSGNAIKALCPFHGDKKTPSLSISKDKQLFHCFGCGKGGTAITYIQEKEGLDFVEAVKLLADRVGLDMPDTRANAGEAIKSNLKQILYAINLEAAVYYREQLRKPIGNAALEYAKSRKLDDRTIKKFGLGYAPPNKELLDILKEKGYTSEQLRLAGITGEGEDGSEYLRFRNRLMFPIIDLRRNVIAFGGRALDEDAQAKYLNTAATPIFNKSYNLFALNIAKNSEADYLVLVEGYMDVVMLHQHGIDTAVATLGTALTQQQAHLAKRYRSDIIISYDSDEAGQMAARRAIELLNAAGAKARVLQQNDCKDPDEYIKKHGAAAFLDLIKKAPVAIEYLHEKLKNSFDLKTAEGKVMYARLISAELAKLSSNVEREVYGRKVAEDAGISYETVASEVAREMRLNSERRIDLTQSRVQRQEFIAPKWTPQKALIALMSRDVVALAAAKKELEPEDFGEFWKDVAKELMDGREAKEIASNPGFAEKMAEISEVFLGNDSIDDAAGAAKELTDKIKRENLSLKMLEAAQAGDTDKIRELMGESNE